MFMPDKTQEDVYIDLKGNKRKSKRGKEVAREDRAISSGDAKTDNLTASLSTEARDKVREALGNAEKAIEEAEKEEQEREKRLRRSEPITGCFGGEPTRRDGCFGRG